MSLFDYTYNKLCQPDRLQQEVENSTISIAISHISTSSSPEQTTLFFKASLPTEDESILSDLINAHVNEPLPEEAILVDILAQKDSDGAQIQRIKTTQTGWSYQLHGVEFTSSKLNSVYSKDPSGTDFNFTTVKLYDANNVEITDPAEEVNCVKTVVDWMPTYDYEIIGGQFRLKQTLNEDMYLWVVGVPDIPEIYGGSKSFVNSINMRYVGLEDGIKADGRSSKMLTYNPNLPTNKLRIILRHEPGAQIGIMMIYEIFKP